MDYDLEFAADAERIEQGFVTLMKLIRAKRWRPVLDALGFVLQGIGNMVKVVVDAERAARKATATQPGTTWDELMPDDIINGGTLNL